MEEALKQLWTEYYQKEQNFLNYVTSVCVEQQSFGLHCYPRYDFDPETNKHSKPRFIRWVGHCSGKRELFERLQRENEAISALYQQAAETEKLSHRCGHFFDSARKLRVNQSDAYSSESPLKVPTLVLTRVITENLSDDTITESQGQLKQYAATLRALGVDSAAVVTTLKSVQLQADYMEIGNLLKLPPEKIVYRTATGTQYRCRLYLDETSKSIQMKLGFIITLDPIEIFVTQPGREERYDSYEKQGIRLDFPVPKDGVFWEKL
ncbi:hypothetical protein [Vibrio chaetopteri]|uniref:Uncharacterized protein n=1 Tax=Vibrio chaetopteri TaxID=3016528 RepID=A0AAU8BTF1_9VIBR